MTEPEDELTDWEKLSLAVDDLVKDIEEALQPLLEASDKIAGVIFDAAHAAKERVLGKARE